MINKDLDLLLLSKLLPYNEEHNLIIPIKLKNENQIKVTEFINAGPVPSEHFKDYFTQYFLIFNGGLNVARVMGINLNGTVENYINNHVHLTSNLIRSLLNAEGRSTVFFTTPFSNLILNTIRKDHTDDLLTRLDASISIVNNPWITSLRDTLKDLAEIMGSNNLDKIDIASLAEYCVLDLIKENTDENKKVEKLLKMIYG